MIKRIRSNLKGGVDRELHAKTLIIGPNGSGKSAITDSVELVLTGRLSDLGGKEAARGTDLLALAPVAESAWATATLEDGAQVEWELQRGDRAGHARRAQGGEAGVLSGREMLDALSGGVTSLRTWLLMRCDLSPAEVLEMIPPGAAQEFAVKHLPHMGLVEVIARAKKNASEASVEAKGLASAISQLGRGAAPPPTEVQIEALKARLKRVTEQLDAHRRQADIARGAQLGDKIVELERALVAEQAKVETLSAQAPTDLPEHKRAAAAIVAYVVAQAQAGGDGVCPACGEDSPFDLWTARHRKIQDVLRRRKLLTVDLDAAECRVQGLRHSLRSAKEARSSLGPVVVPDETLPPKAELEAEAERLQNEISTALANGLQWRSLQKARQGQQAAQEEAVAAKRLVEDLQAGAAALLHRVVQTLIEKVQTYLPKNDVFGLELYDGDREVCRWGLARGGQLHTALSGAEWARVVGAMASAFCPPESVLIFPDRALDPSTLFHVLEALRPSPQQVLVTSPVKPIAIPAGWHVIKLEGAA